MAVGCKLQGPRGFCFPHLCLRYIEYCGAHRKFWKWADTGGGGWEKVERHPPQILTHSFPTLPSPTCPSLSCAKCLPPPPPQGPSLVGAPPLSPGAGRQAGPLDLRVTPSLPHLSPPRSCS